MIGRLVAPAEVRESRTGKPYVRYVLATTDPLGPPNEDGTQPEPTSSFHSIFGFGESNVARLSNVPKGSLMYVEGDFRVTRSPSEGDLPPQEQWLVQHRSHRVLSRPKTDA